jgi:chorismate mutase-like protein
MARVTLLLWTALFLVLQGQPNGEVPTPPGEPSLAVQERVLRVGTSGDYAPFSLDGKGFDVEVAEALARDLAVRIEWVRFRWPELASDAKAGRFDVAMSGITWLPERAMRGYLTRAVAAGGPCLLGAPAPRRVGVNRGGALERWVLAAFPDAEHVLVERNQTLPGLLREGRVDAIVTDRFELPHFRVEGFAERCEPPRDRKVYWVTRTAAASLGPRIDAWLADHEPLLQSLRARHFGAPEPRDELDHLIDLLARRLQLMPHVAAWKRASGAPLEDPPREARVLERAEEGAAGLGLDAAAGRALFAVQIELAKAVQARAPAGVPADLDLATELRPELDRLGARILEAAARAAPVSASSLEGARFAPVEPWLEPAELERLRQALLALRRSAAVPALRRRRRARGPGPRYVPARCAWRWRRSTPRSVTSAGT